MEGESVLLGPSEGKTVEGLGNRVIYKVSGAQTGGALSVVVYTAGPRWAGPPPHRHAGFDEMFYVLDGELTVQVGQQVRRAGRGSTLFVPRGAAHGFTNPGDSPVQVLMLFSPAGFERYFEELTTHIQERGGAPEWSFVQGLLQKYGVEAAGPPAWAR